MNKWKDVWSNKGKLNEEKFTDEFDKFKAMKRADGFDVAVENEESYYRHFYGQWINFFEHVKKMTNGKIESVYEVGCGTGVNLFMFRNRLHCETGGCDYSGNMIESAINSTGCNDFTCCDAADISVVPSYDLVMSESVFQYFQSLEYAEDILRKMIEKSNKLTYVGEVHDKKYEKDLISYRKKTISDYEKKYQGLTKLFFEKEWFEKIAADYGKKCEFTEIDNPEYINGKFEFNCYIV